MLLEYFAATPALFIGGALLTGLLVGSFLNVVIHRLPIMLQRSWRAQCADLEGGEAAACDTFNLVVPGSRCPSCGHPISAFENIPLVSYLFQKGLCRHCRAPIGMRYPVVEAASGLLTFVVAWHLGFGLAAVAAMLLTWTLIALTVIDFDHQLLPDDITLPVLWLGLILNLSGTFTDIRSALIGAIAGYLSLWAVFHLFRLLTGKEGMGYGDFKLLALLGAWLGWQMLPLIILLSSLVGALVGVGLILLRGHDRNIPIPFGPYLAAAGWLALIWGGEITSAYLGGLP